MATLENQAEQNGTQTKKKGRGPTKRYPVKTFEDSLRIPKGILEYGVGDQMRRLTLFQSIGISSPDSSATRDLLTSSGRYGLTTGSYSAEYLSLTADGKSIVVGSHSDPKILEKEFQLAIAQFEPFQSLYERLKNKRFPDPAVLKDELGKVGIAANDQNKAAEVFTENARYLGVVREYGGTNHIIPIKQALEELPSTAPASTVVTGQTTDEASSCAPSTGEQAATQVDVPSKSQVSLNGPTVHIDIQVHIDSSASPEQIDQIFASMARHLYRRED